MGAPGLTSQCRLFVLLSGLAHVTLPSSSDEAWIMEGVNGLLVATDDSGVGHYTAYPSNKDTIALQIPFKGGIIPDYTILKRGACHSPQQIVPEGLVVDFSMGNEL